MSDIATKYAAALAMAAAASGSLDRVLGDFERFARALNASKDFCRMFFAPNFTLRQKSLIYKKMFEPALSAYFLRFLSLLHRNRKERFIFEVLGKYERLCLEAKGARKAYVVTAAPLDSIQKAKIEAVLSKKTVKQVKVENKVDPGIILGALIRLKDTTIDASLASSLNKLRKDLDNC